MGELLRAYISEALPFAVIHAVLMLTCAFIWIADWLRVNAERRAYKALQAGTSSQSSSSSVSELSHFAFSLAQKGSIPDAETLTRRLVKALSTRDAILRACINGLIVVGLLGTLFNLWRLGPAFWSALLEGTNPNRAAIGVAFAASFFGLFWALALNLIDNAVFRPRRGAFARESTEWIMSKAVEQLPHSRDAAVSEGLKEFTKTSEGILRDLKDQHAVLTQSLVDQIRDSSSALDSKLTMIATRWESFFSNAADKVREGGRDLQKAARDLTSATNHASKTLADTTKTLESYKNLSELIAQVRTESANLVSEVTQRMEGFTKQMEVTLSSVTQEHAQALEHESQEANRRLSDLVDAWHTSNAATLGRFGTTIQKASDDFSNSWQGLSKSVDTQILQLVRNWQTSLNDSVIQVADSLKSINEQLRATERLSSGLAKSADGLSRAVEALPKSPAQPDKGMRELLSKLDTLSNNSERLTQEVVRRMERLPNASSQISSQLLDRVNQLPNEIAQAVSRNQQQQAYRPTAVVEAPRSIPTSGPFDSRTPPRTVPINNTPLTVHSTATDGQNKRPWYRRFF